MTVTYRAQYQVSTQRDAWVEIDLSALERNYKRISSIVKTEIMAVVKADAYGHGMTAICPILEKLKVNSFGVATVDEGIALRKAGITRPILVLGATPFWAFESCFLNNLTITLYSKENINQLVEFSKLKNTRLPVQIKVDTGMNRLGLPYSEAGEIIKEVINTTSLRLEGIFTHLSDANDYEFSKLQKERFEQVTQKYKDLKIQKHIANSFAAINYEDFRYDLVRIGIALYGQEFNFLEPIISLKGRITNIHEVRENEFVSYERNWKSLKDSLVATVPIGYADGIDRKLSNNISALCEKKKIKQIGNITMDQMMFDISEARDLKTGDVITLIGKEIPISSWAEKLNTITYELLTRLKMRLPRVYTRN